jgi:hypothetical protein
VDDLSWREKLVMLAVAGTLALLLTLLFVDTTWEYIRPTHPCGAECRAELTEIERIYPRHRDASHSCAAEFFACLENISDN